MHSVYGSLFFFSVSRLQLTYIFWPEEKQNRYRFFERVIIKILNLKLLILQSCSFSTWSVEDIIVDNCWVQFCAQRMLLAIKRFEAQTLQKPAIQLPLVFLFSKPFPTCDNKLKIITKSFLIENA